MSWRFSVMNSTRDYDDINFFIPLYPCINQEREFFLSTSKIHLINKTFCRQICWQWEGLKRTFLIKKTIFLENFTQFKIQCSIKIFKYFKSSNFTVFFFFLLLSRELISLIFKHHFRVVQWVEWREKAARRWLKNIFITHRESYLFWV